MTYRFDDIAVDPVAFRMSRDGRPVHIEPKALQILILLLEHRDRPVTKQELLSEVWAGVAVTENALTRAIAQLRKSLGDNADAPRYVETIPTRGYRFIGTLQMDARGEPAPPPVIAPVPRGNRRVTLVISLLLVAAILTFLGVIATLDSLLQEVKKRLIAVPATAVTVAARPVRVSAQFEGSPSFSPEATSIVYSADVDGTLHLFTSSVDGGAEKQLTSGGAGEAQPSWSPDGKRIAFASVRKPGIWLVDASGGAPVQLTTFGSRPSWSPDGTEIAFQSSDDIEYGWNAYDALPPSAIWIADVRTGKTSRLTTPGQPSGGHGAPSWQRDGKRLVFSSCDHEHCGIFAILRDSSGLTELASDPRRLSSPLFAPDGRTVYFVQTLYNASRLFALAIDTSGKAIGGWRQLRTSNPGVMQHLALSRDGFRFAWTLVEEKSDLFAIDAGSHDAPQPLTRNPMLNATFPSYSPDGTKIAYSAVAAGDDSGIWISEADGSNPKALITGPGLKQYTLWGRNAWSVFYGAWSANDHRPLLYRASLLNGQAEVFAKMPEDASAPMLSPDSKTIAFNRTIDGTTSVWTSALDGSSLHRVSDDAVRARFPVWSPSGKYLAVQLRRDGSSIAIFPGPNVLVTGGENWPHSWSPDEKEIAFAGRRDGVWNVWTVSVATKKAKPLTAFTSTTGWVRTPSWSPDGKRIAFEAGAPRGSIWVSEPRVAQ